MIMATSLAAAPGSAHIGDAARADPCPTPESASGSTLSGGITASASSALRRTCASRSGPTSSARGATSASGGSSRPWPTSRTRDEVEVVYRSFELDPSRAAARRSRPSPSRSAAKYGGGVAGGAADDRPASTARPPRRACIFRHADTAARRHRRRPPAAAPRQDTGGPVQRRAQGGAAARRTSSRPRTSADHDVLPRVAVEAGLDEARVDEVLATDEYADDVEADIAQAARVRRHRRAVLRGRPEVRRLRRPAGRDLRRRCSTAPGRTRHPALEVVGGRRDACGPGRLRDLTRLDQSQVRHT